MFPIVPPPHPKKLSETEFYALGASTPKNKLLRVFALVKTGSSSVFEMCAKKRSRSYSKPFGHEGKTPTNQRLNAD